MGTALKIGLGIFIGGLLLAGACGVLLVATDLDEGTLDGTPDMTETTDAGDRYCSADKEDELAALELGNDKTVNSPRLLRRGTRRLLRENSDAPRGAWCVDQEVEFLIDVWNSTRGEDAYPDAAEQVRRLRKFQRRG